MKKRTILVIAVVVLFVLPASAMFSDRQHTAIRNAPINIMTQSNNPPPTQGSSPPPVTAPSNTTLPYPGHTGRVGAILNSLESNGTPSSEIFLPDFNSHVTMSNGHVQPLYNVAPAPMGVGDFGLKNQNGVIVGYNLTTESVEGTVTMSNLSSLDLPSRGGQTSGSVQLNTVLTNVTLFGVTNYTYWTQNVISYSNDFHQLTFVLNIWNFSTPSFVFPKNGIAQGRGHVEGNEVYITRGPSFSVTLPVTVNLYTNASLVNGDSAVFFNYTLIDNGVSRSGTFDEVLFNSTWGMPLGYHAPVPYYLISGTTVTPTKFLLYDAEMMIGGPGGGSTTTIYNINATMGLMYYNSTSSAFDSVPSAFNFGTDTGETSAGVNVWWKGTTAILNEGPSLLYGMWNVSSVGPQQFKGNVAPSNAFMFVSGGMTFNSSTDAWSPLSLSGNYDFHVPYSSVAGQILLSYYRPVSFVISSGENFNLQRQPYAGIYTPLYAFDNSQVAYIARSGDGSAGSPFVLGPAPAVTNINPLFIELNDYLFPVFAGVFFWNVTVHVDMNSMPLFRVMYGTQLQNTYSLPSVYNYLNYEFYLVSNVSLWQTTVSGYFTDSSFPYNVILVDSSHMLIGGNTLYASA
ncbi:MAG: thermopsin family protease, partial [Candidatus Bathyarchaeia archaeon]